MYIYIYIHIVYNVHVISVCYVLFLFGGLVYGIPARLCGCVPSGMICALNIMTKCKGMVALS